MFLHLHNLVASIAADIRAGVCICLRDKDYGSACLTSHITKTPPVYISLTTDESTGIIAVKSHSCQ